MFPTVMQALEFWAALTLPKQELIIEDESTFLTHLKDLSRVFRDFQCDPGTSVVQTLCRRLFAEYPSTILRDALRDKPLLDLGCGSTWKEMRALALDVKASVYVGVDLIFNPGGQKSDAFTLPFFYVRADMLAALNSVPDGTHNITINNIDSIISPDENYNRAVGKEIGRVVPLDGCVFGFNSEALKFIPGKLIDASNEVIHSNGEGPTWIADPAMGSPDPGWFTAMRKIAA